MFIPDSNLPNQFHSAVFSSLHSDLVKLHTMAGQKNQTLSHWTLTQNMDRFVHIILSKFFKSQARALAIRSFLLPRIGNSIHFRIIENAGKSEINEITCDQGKNEKKFELQKSARWIQNSRRNSRRLYLLEKKRKPDLISHPKSNHSVWTQQGQVIFP